MSHVLDVADKMEQLITRYTVHETTSMRVIKLLHRDIYDLARELREVVEYENR